MYNMLYMRTSPFGYPLHVYLHLRIVLTRYRFSVATNRADLVARRSTVDAQPPLVPVSSLVEPAVETTTSTILLPELPRLELVRDIPHAGFTFQCLIGGFVCQVLSGSVSIHDEPPRATPVANAPDTPSVAPPKLQDAKPSSHYSTAGTYMLIGACAGIVLGLGLPILFR